MEISTVARIALGSTPAQKGLTVTALAISAAMVAAGTFAILHGYLPYMGNLSSDYYSWAILGTGGGIFITLSGLSIYRVKQAIDPEVQKQLHRKFWDALCTLDDNISDKDRFAIMRKIKDYVQQGVDISAMESKYPRDNQQGRDLTPIGFLVLHKNFSIFEEIASILLKKADLTQQCTMQKDNLLHIVFDAKENRVEKLEFILTEMRKLPKGIQRQFLHAQNQSGMTPLHTYVLGFPANGEQIKSSLEMIDRLQKAGAEKDHKTSVNYNNQNASMSPVDFAVYLSSHSPHQYWRGRLRILCEALKEKTTR